MTRVAAFLGAGTRLPTRAALAATKGIAQQEPRGDDFAFVLMLQERTNWCWAAVVQAVNYAAGNRRPDAAVSQTAIAGTHIGRHHPGATCTAPGVFHGTGRTCDDQGCTVGCDGAHAARIVLSERGLFAGSLATKGAVSFESIVRQVDRHKAIVCRIRAGSVAHFVCLTGWWIDADGTRHVIVQDPRRVTGHRQAVPRYMPFDVFTASYPLGAVRGHNDYAYAVN
ncbi:hypothetical protein QLH51_00970 [Sphingomonas sp. 2R-10]|uniref:hypothetical protein n=1 Tax=Sphingomonas sp. 2R-10 TaxID=3045148 RepID=UPI000F78719E|nr:hypothetical protein [Sphingomonas sp. 2R-10]MDJ0275378.1 hypothetical protein [Sphingomonas sp. 2R-10]